MGINKPKKIAVIGYGVTGKSVAKYLLSKGNFVDVYDSKKEEQFPLADLIRDENINFYFETIDFDPSEYFYIVISPGVPLDIETIKIATEKNIKIHNDLTIFIEAWREIGKVVGITGSNGKTTTASLLYEALKKLTPTILAGNIGNSPLDLLDIKYPKGTVAVLEISSNQLEIFRPEHYLDMCIITNLSSNHLDRYGGDMSLYAAAKLRGIDKSKTKTAVCLDDTGTQKFILNQIDCEQLFFVSFETPLDEIRFPGIYTDENSNIIFYRGDDINKPEKLLDHLTESNLVGVHNLYNISFVLVAIKLLDFTINNDVIKTVENFNPLEHRLEKVAEIDGALYINDSKSTSPDSIRVALETFGRNNNIILISGGDDKNMSFNYLAPFFDLYVKKLLIIPGEIKTKLENVAQKSNTDFKKFDDLRTAVDFAKATAEKGDVVLLSPGSYSRNYFSDYKERGKKFKEFVKTTLSKHNQ